MSNRVLNTIALSVACSLSLTLVARGQGIGNVEVADDLIKAAKAEGGLMIYSSADEGQSKTLLAAFEKKYGIPGNFVRFPTAPLMQRFSTEADGKNIQADLLSVSSPIPYDSKPELYVDLSTVNLPNLKKWPAKWVQKNYFTWTTDVVSLAYNTEQIKPGTQPTKWIEIADPKWKGQFILTDPQVADNYLGWLDAVERVVGIDFLKKLATQDYKVTQSGASGAQMVAAGAHQFNAPTFPAFANQLIAKNAPIAIQYMTEPTVVSPRNYALVQGGPHPKAAQLFLNWLLSDEGTRVTCGIGPTNVVADSEGKLGCISVKDGMSMRFDVSEERMKTLAKAIGVAK